MSRGLYIRPEPGTERMARAFAKANREINASIRAQNAITDRNNRRRRFCFEKVLEWCIKQNSVNARVWVTKLVSAGFDPKGGAELEAMPLDQLEAECRKMLGLRERP